MSSGAFGKYEILERIAAGESTELFKARLSGIGGFSRSLAIKRILPHRNRERGFVDAFASEARKAGLLSHANIVQILDLGQVDGAWFVAMEYIDGPNLGRVLERCREKGITLPVPHAVFVCLEILKALEYAHQRQVMRGNRLVSVPVVHHNLCPEKVVISQQGEVKLTDFANPRKSGHPSYRAPEQPDSADVRSDLYATGRLLYEMLTGRLPAETSPEPPSHVNPDVPYPLDVVLGRALQRDLGQRYGSATEMKEALDSFFHDAGFIFSPSTLAAFLKGLFPDPRQRRPQPLDEQETRLLARLNPDDDLQLLDFSTDDEVAAEINELPTRITRRPDAVAAAVAAAPVLPPLPRPTSTRPSAPTRPPLPPIEEQRPYMDTLQAPSSLTQPILDAPEDETLIEQGVDIWAEAKTVIQRDPTAPPVLPPAEALEQTRSTSSPQASPPPPRLPPPPATRGPTVSPRSRSAALSAAAPPPQVRSTVPSAPAPAPAPTSAKAAAEVESGEPTASVSLPLPTPTGGSQRVLVLLSALSVVAMVATLFLGYFIGQRSVITPRAPGGLQQVVVHTQPGVEVRVNGIQPVDGVLQLPLDPDAELQIEVQVRDPKAVQSN